MNVPVSCAGSGTDHPELPAVLWGLYVYHLHRSGVHAAYDVAEELLRLAEQRRDPAACAVGHRSLAVGAMHRGNQQLALAHFELALALYDQIDRRSPVFLSVSDIRVASLNFIPLTPAVAGRNRPGDNRAAARHLPRQRNWVMPILSVMSCI